MGRTGAPVRYAEDRTSCQIQNAEDRRFRQICTGLELLSDMHRTGYPCQICRGQELLSDMQMTRAPVRYAKDRSLSDMQRTKDTVGSADGRSSFHICIGQELYQISRVCSLCRRLEILSAMMGTGAPDGCAKVNPSGPMQRSSCQICRRSHCRYSEVSSFYRICGGLELLSYIQRTKSSCKICRGLWLSDWQKQGVPVRYAEHRSICKICREGKSSRQIYRGFCALCSEL
jgi:hypothetical protein